MKLQSSPLFSAMAAALIFGTLGMSGLVSAVSSPDPTDRTDPIGVTAPPNPAAVNQEFAPADAILETTGAVDPAAEAPAIVVPARVVPLPGLLEQAPVPNQEVAEGHAFGLRLSSDGLLPGRFRFLDSVTGIEVAAERLTISFVQNGKVITRARPGVSGVFQASGLTPGIYSMIASGPDGFLATAISVLPAVNGQGAANEAGLQIDGALVPPENVPLVRKLIRERIFPTRRAVAESTELDRTNRVSKPYRTPLLTIGLDGHLRGRLHRIDPKAEQRTLATECTVFLIRGRQIQARVDVDQNGIFDVDGARWNVEPGEYSLLVTRRPQVADNADAGRTAGLRNGYAALGVTVAKSAALPQPKAVARPKNSLYQLVSSVRLAADDEISEIADIDTISTEDIEAGINGDGSDGDGSGAEVAAAPAEGAGGAGSGGGGGGGGGSGGGGGGLLLGALAGAGTGFAIGGLDNNNVPASPAVVR